MTSSEQSRRYTYELFKLTSELNPEYTVGWYSRNLRITLDHIYTPVNEDKQLNFIKFDSKYKYSPEAYRYIVNCLNNSKKIETDKLVLEHVLPHKILLAELLNKFRLDNTFTYNKFINYLEREFTSERKVIITKKEDVILNKNNKDSVPDRNNPFSRYQSINLKQEDFLSIDTLLFLYYKYKSSNDFSVCNISYIKENIIRAIKNMNRNDIDDFIVKIDFLKLNDSDLKLNKNKYVLLKLIKNKDSCINSKYTLYISLNKLLTASINNSMDNLSRNFRMNLDTLVSNKLEYYFSKI